MGKISLRYYLNKNTKAKRTKTDRGGNARGFALYYYITIRRKTIHKPSILGIYLSTEMLATRRGGTELKGDLLGVAMDYEEDVTKRILALYERDYECKAIRKALLRLGKRAYNSSDEYTNYLNAYVEYYTTPLEELIQAEAGKRIEAITEEQAQRVRAYLGDVSNLIDIRAKHKANAGFELSSYLPYVRSGGGLEELQAFELVKLYRKEKRGIFGTFLLPCYEWEHGDGKAWLWDNLKEHKRRGRKVCECLEGLTLEDYNSKIAPILDKVCTLSDRVDKLYQDIKDETSAGTE